MRRRKNAAQTPKPSFPDDVRPAVWPRRKKAWASTGAGGRPRRFPRSQLRACVHAAAGGRDGGAAAQVAQRRRRERRQRRGMPRLLAGAGRHARRAAAALAHGCGVSGAARRRRSVTAAAVRRWARCAAPRFWTCDGRAAAAARLLRQEPDEPGHHEAGGHRRAGTAWRGGGTRARAGSCAGSAAVCGPQFGTGLAFAAGTPSHTWRRAPRRDTRLPAAAGVALPALRRASAPAVRTCATRAPGPARLTRAHSCAPSPPQSTPRRMCQAVCNDGSPGAFYFHKASDPAMANVWLVFLEGAQAAADTCARTRVHFCAPYFTSTLAALLGSSADAHAPPPRCPRGSRRR